MKITILTTGGTIEKTYNEHNGNLNNDHSILKEILSSLRLPDLEINHVELLNKDSLDMTLEDREVILNSVRTFLDSSQAILILHGTDTLAETGELLYAKLPQLAIPVVLTGAMRPYEFRDSDAFQNVVESLLAFRLLKAGVYVVMHNRVLQFPGVVKDKATLTFRTNVEMEEGRRSRKERNRDTL